MRTEPLAEMENRLSDASAPLWHNLSRKPKRRSSRRSNTVDAWNCGQQSSQDGGLMSGVEYHPPRMMWPSSMTQNVQSSGQRLFAAMSDPSVCGYSPMPVTYTMQPVSLPPMYSLYQPVPLPNVRTVHHSTSRPVRSERSAHVRSRASAANGCRNTQENGLEPAVHIAHHNGDYASLPPTADSGVNGDELNSEHRRYSDPGLGPAKVSSQPDSDDSVESESSVITIGRTNKLALSLMEQITDLKKYNSQLFKELGATKSYFESMKAELVQYKHCASSDYQPGMLSDFIREIREAQKKYEEGLTAKVTFMLEERRIQQATEIEELKNQLSKVTNEYEESKKRIAALEEELTALKLSATLEKLVEILRKKVNGATAVNKIRDVPASGVCADPFKEPANHVPPSSSSSSSSSADEKERAKSNEDEEDDDEDEDDDIDGENSDASGSGKDLSIADDPKSPSTNDSSVNLSGPVTEL